MKLEIYQLYQCAYIFDKQLDEIIINKVNRVQNWLISPSKRDGQFGEEMCIFFVDNGYYKCDANGVKNSLQNLVMMGYLNYATELG